MDENKKRAYDKSGPIVAKNLRKRYFDAYYVSNASEAVEKVLELIPETDVVSWGGSMTIDALGIKDMLLKRGNPLIDRDTARTQEERNSMLKQALTCDTFLMSSNAVSADGQLVNIDGTGNRLAAMIFGPDSIIVVAGMNKVVPTADDAMKRARAVAAPLNAQRFEIDTPCNFTGQCADCTSPQSICTYLLTTRISRPAGRIKVVLVGEDLGL